MKRRKVYFSCEFTGSVIIPDDEEYSIESGLEYVLSIIPTAEDIRVRQVDVYDSEQIEDELPT